MQAISTKASPTPNTCLAFHRVIAFYWLEIISTCGMTRNFSLSEGSECVTVYAEVTPKMSELPTYPRTQKVPRCTGCDENSNAHHRGQTSLIEQNVRDLAGTLFVTVTLTPGNTAPEESVTVPRISPEFEFCARTEPAKPSASPHSISIQLRFIILLPPKSPLKGVVIDDLTPVPRGYVRTYFDLDTHQTIDCVLHPIDCQGNSSSCRQAFD